MHSYKSGLVHHTRYNGFLSKNGFRLFTSKGDTVVKGMNNYYQDWEFRDIDGDGNKDILLFTFSIDPGACELFLFSPLTNTFIQVQGDFPAPEKIPHSRYFYSYHHDGCADMNWESDLFYIRNFKAIRVGNIAGHECGDDGIKDGIYISKVHRDKEQLFRKLPIRMIHRYKRDKWGFIAKYWTRNYRKFI